MSKKEEEEDLLSGKTQKPTTTTKIPKQTNPPKPRGGSTVKGIVLLF